MAKMTSSDSGAIGNTDDLVQLQSILLWQN